MTSLLVQAELTQIRSTLKLEMELSSQSWWDMLATPGMRRRVFISAFIGLFTQMSGNTLLGYYSGKLFGLMGYTSAIVKNQINIANQCWSLLNATIIAMFVTRFRRRWMFMLSSSTMLMMFIGMTVSFKFLQDALAINGKNPPAQIAALFFYFAYSPCYNIGNNALTYSVSCSYPTCPFLYANMVQPTSWNYSPMPKEHAE
jgi:hypothetical protein